MAIAGTQVGVVGVDCVELRAKTFVDLPAVLGCGVHPFFCFLVLLDGI
jgi:hypothetical protein